MAISINDLDDDDILEVGEDDSSSDPGINQEPPVEPSTDDGQEDSFMLDFLKSKGIDDPSKIKFEDEQGNIEERNWKDLSREEQFNILNTPITQEVEDNNLDDEEIELINSIRQSGLTPSQYLEQFKGEVVEPTYKIDDLSDDEIYLLDLESRVGELSDEDAAQALNIAKQNEDFFKKQVEGIRKEYKEREDLHTKQAEDEAKEQQQAAYNEYSSQIVEVINGFNSVGNLDLSLEDKDKENLADFILSQDQSGVNYLWQAFQDPETLVKAAWFILNGEEAFDEISDYFTNEIKLRSEAQYKKGFEDGKKGVSSKPALFIDNSKKTTNQRREYKSIEDLDDDD